MVPEPEFSFTIPSIHNKTSLECRVYHPPSSYKSGQRKDRSGQPRGAIIAHPYAPLGGSYDDHIVLCTIVEALQEGFVVGTFNFRYLISAGE